MEEIIVLLLGITYGLIIGIIPVVGATTGLVALYPFIGYFSHNPYLGVVFCVAVVAASTTGDTFSGILLGIPGANSAAATMVDGFPLALKGKAAYALSAAFTVSTSNGLLWGSLTFLLLPLYAKIILKFGIPELFAFALLAFASVGFVSSKYWFRSLIAIIIGILIGLVGIDVNASPRWTFGWDYLLDGVQLIPVVVGLFAVPELLDGLRKRMKTTAIKAKDFKNQTFEGIKAGYKHWRFSLLGGFIGSIIGILPGLGGAIADWLAYGQTVAMNPSETFGNGNIKGVIGCEGANNAQKASSFIPTVLFGIPGAPFAAVLISLFMYLNIEMGSIELANDTRFFNYLSFSFLVATFLTGIICIFLCRFIAKISVVPYKHYFPVLMALVIWASMQYTGGWEDFVILLIMCIIGIAAKQLKFSRPSLLIGFILAERIEKLSLQTFKLYNLSDLFRRPVFIVLIIFITLIIVTGLKNRNRLEYN
jgi:TctA family transporter